MSHTHSNPESIKAHVREYYGRVAEKTLDNSCCGKSTASPCCGSSATSPCCSPIDSPCCGEEQGSQIYGTTELADVPDGAVASSRGCGNPIALASLKEGEVVLDLGSGGGLDALLAAKRVGTQGFVYGLDMTDSMLELARRNAEQVGATNVAFLKGDIENIPLPDASVDVIISNCVINLAPNKGQTLREALRVLRPGGRLAVTDIVIDGGLEGLPVGEQQVRAALSWAGCIAGALTSDQYRQLLAEAGFEEINVEVLYRYSLTHLLPLPQTLAGLAPSALHDLVSRFTSSSITARRPATT